MDMIKITNLEIFAHHGVFPEETRDGQNFYINAKLYLDCRKAGQTDDLEQSVNYGEVCHFMTKYLKEHTFLLLESAAEHMTEQLLLEYPLLRSVEFEICKPHAPIGLPFDNVSVTVQRGWHTAYLSVGSNMGEKEVYIKEAVEKLQQHPQITSVQMSQLIVTKPYGGVEQDDFVNGAIKLETLLTQQELLAFLHEMEHQANRKREIRWGPRTLDLDIIFYDKLVYEDEDLIIPHVDMENRTFVLKPLAELCPNYRHPILQKTVTQMLKTLEEK